MIPTLALVLGCADPTPTTNTHADRAVEPLVGCPDTAPHRLTFSVASGKGPPSSVRVGWRANSMDPWREVGRKEHGAAAADLPGGGEAVMLGVGIPSCVPPLNEEDNRIAPAFFTTTKSGWDCVRDVRVVDAEDAPVAGAEVWLATERGGRLRGELVGWTEEDGWARQLPAQCGPVAAGAVADGLSAWGALSAEDTTTVVLPEPNVHLHGRVRSGDTPVAGARITLTPKDGEDTDQALGPMSTVSAWTDEDGHWSANLALRGDHALLYWEVEADGFVRHVTFKHLSPGQDRAVYADLDTARRVHLRCIGGPEDSCDNGQRRSVRCGPPGDLVRVSANLAGEDGPRQLSVQCPDLPDLRLSLDGDEAFVYGDVAWFEAP